MNNAHYLKDDDDEAERKAIERGDVIVKDTPTTLLLDIDSPEREEIFIRSLPIVRRMYPSIKEAESWSSKSGRLHIVLSVDEAIPVTDRLLLQAILGSDPIREALSLMRHRAGIEQPSWLFRPLASVSPHTLIPRKGA